MLASREISLFCAQEMLRNDQFMHGRAAAPALRSHRLMAKSVRKKNKLRSALKTILVAIDFSPPSRRALKHALGLADNTSRVILLHVLQRDPDSDVDLANAIADARQKLKQLCSSDGVVAPELIEPAVRSGAPFREILACAKENETEMIILGVDQSSILGGVTLGHTADRVSRYAKCPVLLVREEDVDLTASKKA
jgi:nucleotide-binding universal stress UspA family protein